MTRKPTAGSAPRAWGGPIGTAHGATTALRALLADIMLQFLVSGAAERRAVGLAQGPRGPRPAESARGPGPAVRWFCFCLAHSLGQYLSAAIQVPKTLRCQTEYAFSELLTVCGAPRPSCNRRVEAFGSLMTFRNAPPSLQPRRRHYAFPNFEPCCGWRF